MSTVWAALRSRKNEWRPKHYLGKKSSKWAGLISLLPFDGLAWIDSCTETPMHRQSGAQGNNGAWWSTDHTPFHQKRDTRLSWKNFKLYPDKKIQHLLNPNITACAKRSHVTNTSNWSTSKPVILAPIGEETTKTPSIQLGELLPSALLASVRQV